MSIDLLQEKIRKLKNPLIVDFAIKESLLPPHGDADFTHAYPQFCEELLGALAGVVPGVRFSFDAFALMGDDGLAILSQLLKKAQELGFYVLLDAPQTLTPWSAERAAEVIFGGDRYPCHGLLVSPYIGSDGLKPFLPYCNDGRKALFVTVRSPNKSASELQDLLTGTRLAQEAAAELVQRFGESIVTKCGYSTVCAAVSAGSPGSIQSLRSRCKRMFMLVDGVDYPSGNVKNCSYAFDRLGFSGAISVGPSVTAAWRDAEESDGSDYVQHALRAVERIRKNILRYISIF